MAYTPDEIASGAAIRDILFSVRRSVRYHNARRAFYDFWNTLSNALAVLLGSATVGGIIGRVSAELTAVAAAAVTVVSTLNLVWGTSRMARLHADLARRFVELEKEIVGTMVTVERVPGDIVFALVARRLEIEADEPPVKKILNSMCQNEVLRSEGFGEDRFISIAWYQRMFAQFFDIGDHTLRRKGAAPH
jgi:hypothetical protein